MAILEIFSWWYASGWRVIIKKTFARLSNVVDFFSMGSLIRTLFKPFRQISANSASADASLDLKFHLFIDRLVSRFIGFCSRLILLIVGLILIVISAIFSFILIILWPIVPFAPIAGLILTVTGVVL